MRTPLGGSRKSDGPLKGRATREKHSGLNEVKASALRRWPVIIGLLALVQTTRLTGGYSLSKKVTERWPFFSLEILELRERMRYNSEG